MNFDEHSITQTLSRLIAQSSKNEERSPDLLGQLRLQRHTFSAIEKEFQKTDADEVICNLAGWGNRDTRGDQYLTIEISKYLAQQPQTPKRSSLDFIFNNEKE